MRLKLTEDVSRRMLLLLASLGLTALVLTGLQGQFGNLPWRLQFLVNQGQLEWENNAAVWLSSVTFLAAGVSALLCWIVDRRMGAANGRAGGWQGLAHHGWLFVLAIFVLLSWDELGSLHERVEEIPVVSNFLIAVPGVRAWAAVLLVPIAAVALGILAFGFFHVRLVSESFILLVVGTLFLASIPLQEHVESAMRAAASVHGTWRRPALLAVLEEGTELAGAFAFFAGHLTYLHRRLRNLGVVDGRLVLTISLPVYIGFGALLLCGLAYVHIAIPHLMYLGDGRGVPQNWFPATAALSVGSLILASRGEVANRRWALGLLGACLLMLSVDHAANFAWRDQFFATKQLDAWVRVGVVCAILAALIAAAATAVRNCWFTALAILWGLLLFLAEREAIGAGGRVVASLLAHLCLGLGVMLARREFSASRT